MNDQQDIPGIYNSQSQVIKLFGNNENRKSKKKKKPSLARSVCTDWMLRNWNVSAESIYSLWCVCVMRGMCRQSESWQSAWVLVISTGNLCLHHDCSPWVLLGCRVYMHFQCGHMCVIPIAYWYSECIKYFEKVDRYWNMWKLL